MIRDQRVYNLILIVMYDCCIDVCVTCWGNSIVYKLVFKYARKQRNVESWGNLQPYSIQISTIRLIAFSNLQKQYKRHDKK